MKPPPLLCRWNPLRLCCCVGLLMLAVAAGLVLYFFDPTTAGFYPLCPLHATTGLQCPGCGTLRALHALTHGDLAAAWHFNAFFLVLLPVGAWLGLRQAVRWVSGRQLPGLITRPAFAWVFAAAVVIWGVARNLGK